MIFEVFKGCQKINSGSVEVTPSTSEETPWTSQGQSGDIHCVNQDLLRTAETPGDTRGYQGHLKETQRYSVDT